MICVEAEAAAEDSERKAEFGNRGLCAGCPARSASALGARRDLLPESVPGRRYSESPAATSGWYADSAQSPGWRSSAAPVGPRSGPNGWPTVASVPLAPRRRLNLFHQPGVLLCGLFRREMAVAPPLLSTGVATAQAHPLTSCELHGLSCRSPPSRRALSGEGFIDAANQSDGMACRGARWTGQ